MRAGDKTQCKPPVQTPPLCILCGTAHLQSQAAGHLHSQDAQNEQEVGPGYKPQGLPGVLLL